MAPTLIIKWQPARSPVLDSSLPGEGAFLGHVRRIRSDGAQVVEPDDAPELGKEAEPKTSLGAK